MKTQLRDHFTFLWNKYFRDSELPIVFYYSDGDTLASFDQTDPNSTFTPFGAGCGTIVHYPYLEIGRRIPGLLSECLILQPGLVYRKTS